jgi:hypothetical protein
MEKGPAPYHVATQPAPAREPRTYPKHEAEQIAAEMTRDTGVKHIAYPWKRAGEVLAYVVGRKVSVIEALK